MKESKKWLKEYNNILQRSFKKIRITKPRRKSEVIYLMREKAQLMKNNEILKECLTVKNVEETSPIIDKMTQIQNEIDFIDIEISDLISARNVLKINHWRLCFGFAPCSLAGASGLQVG